MKFLDYIFYQLCTHLYEGGTLESFIEMQKEQNAQEWISEFPEILEYEIERLPHPFFTVKGAINKALEITIQEKINQMYTKALLKITDPNSIFYNPEIFKNE